MKIKVSENEYSKIKSREKVLCECDYCNNDFFKLKSDLYKKIKNGDETLFCSTSCFNKFLYDKNGFSEEKKNKIREKIKQHHIERLNNGIYKYHYKCVDCGCEFDSNRKTRKDREIKCDECKKERIIQNIEKINNLFELSSRTRHKIIKKGLIKCSLCGWDKTTCDIHHINGRKIEDAHNHKNLIYLCPNCHRLAHDKKISKEELNKFTLDIVFKNWKNFYNKL